MVGSLIMGGAALLGASMASKSAKKAAQTQAASVDKATEAQLQATREALAAQEQQYQRAKALYLPERQRGGRADAILDALKYGSGSYAAPVDPDAAAPTTLGSSYAPYVGGAGAGAPITYPSNSYGLHLDPRFTASLEELAIPGWRQFRAAARAAGDTRTDAALFNAFQQGGGATSATAADTGPTTSGETTSTNQAAPLTPEEDPDQWTRNEAMTLANESPWATMAESQIAARRTVNQTAVADALRDWEAKAGATGSYLSGNTLRGMADINQRYNDALEVDAGALRSAAFDDWYGEISKDSARGVDATGQTASYGQNYANNASQLYSNQGSNLSRLQLEQGRIAADAKSRQSDIWGGAINSAAYAISDWLGGSRSTGGVGSTSGQYWRTPTYVPSSSGGGLGSYAGGW